MSNIVPKLNLNKLPRNCEDYSLTCAKNVKIVDNTVINFDKLDIAVESKLLGTNGLIVAHDVDNCHNATSDRGSYSSTANLGLELQVVGCVVDIDKFYMLYAVIGYTAYAMFYPSSGTRPATEVDVAQYLTDYYKDCLSKYLNCIVIVEKPKDSNSLSLFLGYNAFLTVYPYIENATIDGNVIKSPKGDTIIELHQYSNEFDVNVPVSFINLEEHRFSNIFDIYDTETGIRYIDVYQPSFYTQTPIVPIVNFLFKEYVNIAIQSGVYSLFIRFKTIHDSYSNWMSCSKPYFIGNHKKTDTQVGSFYYSDSILLASDYTVAFELDAVFIPDYYKKHKIQIEIGYICKTEDEEYAAKLKEINVEFDENGSGPTFTFVPSHANDERIDINDLLEPTYNIYNVKNVTVKDNTFFASNYKETKINEDINISDVKINASSFDVYKTHTIEPENNSYDILDKIDKELSNLKDNTKTDIKFYANTKDNYFDLSIKTVTNYDSGNKNFISTPVCVKRAKVTYTDEREFNYDYWFTNSNKTVDKVSDNIKFETDPAFRNIDLYLDINNGFYVKGTFENNTCSLDNNTLNNFVTNVLRYVASEQINNTTLIDSKLRDKITNVYNAYTIQGASDFISVKNVLSLFVITITNGNTRTEIIKLYNGNVDNPFTAYNISSSTAGVRISCVIQKDSDGDTSDSINNELIESVSVLKVQIPFVLSYDASYYKNQLETRTNIERNTDTNYFKHKIARNYEVWGWNLIGFVCNDDSGEYGHYGESILNDTKRLVLTANINKNKITFASTYTSAASEDDQKLEGYKVIDNVTTLIPYQTYDFYIHFVKNTGEITNGKYVGSLTTDETNIDIEALCVNKTNVVSIYPKFRFDANLVDIPKDFVLYFYSFKKHNTYIANGIKPDSDNIFDVPEMDLFLFNRYKQDCIGFDITENQQTGKIESAEKIIAEGEYVVSTDTKDKNLFCNSGKYKTNLQKNVRLYFESKKYNDENTLYRCTPYIPITLTRVICAQDKESSEEAIIPAYKVQAIEDLYFDGYICKVYKPLNNISDLAWIDDQCYKKNSGIDSAGNVILTNLVNVWDSDNGIVLNYTPQGTIEHDLLSFASHFEVNITVGATSRVYYNPADVEKLKITELPTVTSLVTFDHIKTDELYKSSKLTLIYSNYNLNFLRLREDLVQIPKTIKIKLPSGFKVNSNDVYELIYETIYQTLYIYKISGTTLDSAYKTIPFYRDYTQLIYAPYDKNATNDKYDITIRKTERLKDIIKWSVPRFKSTLLYNLENHKGNITNLVAVGNRILVHTEKGLFTFESNSKLVSNNGEINVENTEIFDINPVEVTGSQNGYGGLQDKRQAAVCFEGYVFADISSNEIFTYSENGFVNLTNHLKYLLEYCDIVDFRAANIQKHHICLCCVTLKNKITSAIYKVTLSYNFVTESFISLHDFAFTKSYANSINTILEHEEEVDIEEPEEGKTTIFTNLVRNYSTFDFTAPFTTVPSFAEIIEEEAILYPTLSHDDIFKSYIDVIVVNNYELVKVLEFLNWSLVVPENIISGNNIAEQGNTAEIHYNCDLYNNGNEQPYNKENAESVMICSDSASTAVIGLETPSNDKDLNLETSYTKARYNAGIWSLNYFRNIKSKDSSEQTLIYGKYFVVRFVFNAKRFKFETLTLKLNKYV